MQPRDQTKMMSFCVLGLPPSHRSASKKVVIELYCSYQDISRVFDNTNCTSIASYSQLVSNQYSLNQLSNSVILNGNINIYGRTINESGNTYLCLVYYKDTSFIHSLNIASNLHLLDLSISTFINILPNKSNVSINFLKNIQNTIDFLNTINAQYSHDSRDLVYWDNRCKSYTQQITNNTPNKQPIITNAFKHQTDTYYNAKESNNNTTHYNHKQRRYGDYFTQSKYRRYQRYNNQYNNQYNDTNDNTIPPPRKYERSKSYYAVSNSQKNVLNRTEYKWSRKSTTNIHDIEKEKEQKEEDTNTKKDVLPTKYDNKINEITKGFSDLSQLVTELRLNDEDEDDIDDIDTQITQSAIQQSVTEDTSIDFVSNATVIIHEDDLKEREEDRRGLKETDQERRSRSHHRRSKPSPTRNITNFKHHENMSDTLIQFQLKYKKANSVKKTLITHLKTLLDEVENDVLPSFEDDEESLSTQEEEENDDMEQAQRLQLQKLKTSCTAWLKLPSSRMAQSGIADGLVLMKNLFDTFTSNDVLNGEHISLYNQVFSKMIKYVPYNQQGPLISPTASTSSVSEMASHRAFNTAQTPFNTPNMSRSSSINTPLTPSIGRIGTKSDSIPIIEQDFASNIPTANPERTHHRSRSSIEEVINECDDALKQHFNKMMGTIGNDSEFKEKIEHLLVEVANNYSNPIGNEIENENEDINVKKPQKRQSLRITNIKSDFVSEIIRIESDREIEEKYWKTLSWDFDAIRFGNEVKVSGNCVVVLGWHFIKINGWNKSFNLTPHKLISFLYQIQESYRDNWYHNKYHAADVMNNMYWFTNNCGSIQPYLDSFDRFICVISAALHDVDHNGYNNSYHQRTKSYLAIRYNDQSILENHHISYSFKLISSNADYDWISDFNDDGLIEKARKYLIRLVLKTDMSVHKKHLQVMNTLTETLSKDPQRMEEDDKIDLLGIILHAADIANAAKERGLCVEWAKRCIEEFRKQGDDEKRLFGEESQLLFNRKHPLEKSQVGWINFVMLPYFEPLNKLLKDDIKCLIQNLKSNLKQWIKYKEYKDEEKSQ